MLPSLAITLTRTLALADDPRTQLEFWLEEAATVARGMCSEHDFSCTVRSKASDISRLTLAATDRVWAWAAYPGTVTNLADVITNGDARRSPNPCPTHLGPAQRLGCCR
jgi:hypothetical protein